MQYLKQFQCSHSSVVSNLEGYVAADKAVKTNPNIKSRGTQSWRQCRISTAEELSWHGTIELLEFCFIFAILNS